MERLYKGLEIIKNNFQTSNEQRRYLVPRNCVLDYSYLFANYTSKLSTISRYYLLFT